MSSQMFKFLCFFLLSSNVLLNVASNGNRSNTNDTQSLSLFNASLDSVAYALSSDSQQNLVGREVNGNVEFLNPGFINLTVIGNQLQMEIRPQTCVGTLHICYETESGLINPRVTCPQMPSYCGLKITGDELKLYVQNNPDGLVKSALSTRASLILKSDEFEMYSNSFPSCKPKIENGMIRMYVIKAECDASVIGAKIKNPEVATTPSASAASSDDSASSSGFSNYGWIILVVGFILFVVVVGAIIGIICYRKRRPSKKAAAAPLPVTVDDNVSVGGGNAIEESIPTITVATTKTECDQEAAVEKPAKKKTEVPPPPPIAVAAPPRAPSAAVVDPPKLEKNNEIAPASAVAPPAVIVDPPKPAEKKDMAPADDADAPILPPVAPADPPKPAPKTKHAPALRSCKSKSRKSRMTSSVSDQRKLNKLVPVESVVESVRRFSMDQSDGKIYAQMKEDYPDSPQRFLQERELAILCMPIGEMVKEIKKLSVEAEAMLRANGTGFDDQGRIVSMSPKSRRFLLNPRLPATFVYLAFGAEYHQFVSADLLSISRYSCPLLYSVVLQSRFQSHNRRKALTYLRRTLPSIREMYTDEERSKLPYPVNAISFACEKNELAFSNMDDIHTHSDEFRKRRRKAKEIEAAAAPPPPPSKETLEAEAAPPPPSRPSKKQSKKKRTSNK